MWKHWLTGLPAATLVIGALATPGSAQDGPSDEASDRQVVQVEVVAINSYAIEGIDYRGNRTSPDTSAVFSDVEFESADGERWVFTLPGGEVDGMRVVTSLAPDLFVGDHLGLRLSGDDQLDWDTQSFVLPADEEDRGLEPSSLVRTTYYWAREDLTRIEHVDSGHGVWYDCRVLTDDPSVVYYVDDDEDGRGALCEGISSLIASGHTDYIGMYYSWVNGERAIRYVKDDGGGFTGSVTSLSFGNWVDEVCTVRFGGPVYSVHDSHGVENLTDNALCATIASGATGSATFYVTIYSGTYNIARAVIY